MLAAISRLPDCRLRDPQLAVTWESRRRNLSGSLRAVLGGPRAPKSFLGGPYFRDSWVRAPWPKRALLASALWHIVLIFIPLPHWKGSTSQAQLTMPQIEVTWYGPIRDLPQVNPDGPPSRPSPPGEPNKPVPRRGADAYHPRQTIISAPKIPTHPRQTLIQPDALPDPPKILLQIPNIVQWADASQPARPRLQINLAVLAKLRPKRPRVRPASELPLPEVPNLEQQAGELNIASSTMTVPKPQLSVPATFVPHTGPRQAGQEAPAPDVGPNVGPSDAGVRRLVAISSSPAPPVSNLPLPSGNLTSRISISPEGTQPGAPGGSPNGIADASGNSGGGPGSPGGSGGAGGTQRGNGGGNGGGPPGVSITGGSPNAVSSSSGLGGPGGGSPGPPSSPTPRPASPEPSRRSPAPGFDRLKPGASPEEIFGPKRVYTLHVNMPNLASATGSWILSFAEMRQDEEQPKPSATSGDLTGPVPLRKVDPKYPPLLASAKVEGEVVLYAVIRRDGSVDSIQLVRGIEPELDTNAMEALARWRFRPAERKGAPVELEAIVHIPFRAVPPLD